MKFVLHQWLHREQHVAVRVVEQIERRQDNQRGARLEISLGHGSSEYSTPRRCELRRNPPRRSTPRYVAHGTIWPSHSAVENDNALHY